MRQLLVLLLAFPLAGCGVGDVNIAKYIPVEADSVARGMIRLVVVGQTDSALSQLDPRISPDSARVLFVRLHEELAGAVLDSLVAVGTNSNTTSAGGVETTSRTLTYQLQHRGKWYWLAPALWDSGGRIAVTGFRYEWREKDPIAAAKFTFEGKGMGHYLFLVMMAGCGLIALTTAVWVGRQQGFPRRFWWAAVSLVGAGVVSLDWNSGQFGHRFFHATLFCFGALKGGPASPWLLSFAFPAGALLAISRVRAWRRTTAAPPATEARAGSEV